MIVSAVMNVMRIDLIAMVASFAVASFLLFGCSDDKGESSEPNSARNPGGSASTPPTPTSDGSASVPALPRAPRASLRFGSFELVGGTGTRCWESMCIDYVGPVTPAGAIEMNPAEPFELIFEEGTPDEVVLTVFDAPFPEPTPEDHMLAWSIDPRTSIELTALQAPAEPGRYIISAFARWDGKGDISYGWYVEVR